MTASTRPRSRAVRLRVNGAEHEVTVEPRRLLSDVLRDDCGLTGTNVGCEHGVCGACTVLIDDQPARSCLMFAVQAGGRSIRTVEGLAGPDGALHPIQESFRQAHALQCGFCTPGFLMLTGYLVEQEPDATPERVREVLGANFCRCTGYANILTAVDRVLHAPNKFAVTGEPA